MSILLLHGVGGRPRSWDAVLAHLDVRLRREALAVDIAVHTGQSVADTARDVLRRHTGAHLIVGHSFGGMLAQEAALIDPARVRGLVLVSTIPGATARVAGINRALADDIEARGLEKVAVEFATRLFAPGRLARSPHLTETFVADMLEAGASSVCAALRAIADWDASSRLAALRCPVAVIAGDAETDLDRQAMLAELAGARFDVLGDTGHLAPLEAPLDVARAISRIAGGVRLAAPPPQPGA